MHIYRILHAAYGPNFRELWPAKKISPPFIPLTHVVATS